jgi:hypothetical protein
MNKPVQSTKTRGTLLERIGWFCLQADHHILEQSPPADRIKYQGLGWSIIGSLVVASLAGAYGAILFLQDFSILECIIGVILSTLLIGFGMFHLYLWSFRSIGVGDGTAKISLSELLRTLPQLILCLIVGIILSTPVEMLILQSEVKTATYAYNIENELHITKSITKMYIEKEKALRIQIADAERKIISTKHDVEQLRTELKTLKEEIDRTPDHLRSTKTTTTPSWSNKVEISRRLETQLELSQKTQDKTISAKELWIENLERQLDTVDQQKYTALNNAITEWQTQQSLWDSIQILRNIGGMTQQFIQGIVMTILLSPIVFTMMLSRSYYVISHEHQPSKSPSVKGDFL